MNMIRQSVTTVALSMKSLVVLFLVLIVPFSIQFGQGMDGQSSAQPREFNIAGSQVFNIHSAITGQDYVLHISLPQHYSDTTKTFPVVYLMDSQWDFPLVTAIYGDQYYDGFMPSTIIAGITWGGQNPDYDKRRAFDLTPTDNNQPSQFGNAEKFLSFINHEVIPFVDSKYRTNKNDRTLAGHSFGGLFTLYALFTEPNLFNRFIAGSPAWGWDRASVYKYTDSFSKTSLRHPVRVYAFIGEYEDVSGFEKLMTAIQGYKIQGLELEKKVIQGSGHAGTKPEGYNRGLQSVFARKSINMNPGVLDQYVGDYEVNPQMKIKILREDDHLVAIAPDHTRIPVFAETENDYYVKGQFLNVHFQKDDKGKVSGFFLRQYAGESFVKKSE